MSKEPRAELDIEVAPLPALETAFESRSIPDIVYNQLRMDILESVFPPGHILRQEELAKRFHASRVPIREALARLDSEGLISLRPRRGYVVASLSPTEIAEIFDIRAVLEEHAGMLAARNRTKEDIAQVKNILQRMSALKVNRNDNFDNWLKLNYEFHNRLIMSAGRKRLHHLAHSMRNIVEPYIRIEMRLTGEVEDAQRDHKKIFEMFCNGDAKGLARASRKHVEGTANRLLKGLQVRIPTKSAEN